mmetsp:Transcript_29019/g.33194  ORF Transcript_29019/g.33194 Transcript_29019/m.33194 type:complete len:156 (+) Transcript_29019:93-560(+)|eukprot:CAMPEP_0115012152 /NCGR_PEP_ID=MMETSP0216-20121206/24534_1 /TAXON_ID=223996 /ORGANISM="Protocruzia adherens, Strain Boccale" /LENGTH=155 /DNA_ID=CAMNT_0002381089 /DNA_START=44 /DNA_END=511 /DNA_ORIENTATION=-
MEETNTSSLPIEGKFYNIRVHGGVSTARLLLSCQDDTIVNSDIENHSCDRQMWEFIPVAGSNDLFNIKTRARTIKDNRYYLSCRADGYVDVFFETDGSGRQTWRLIQLEDGSFNIKVSDGTGGKVFLNCSETGELVDLAYKDDRSGRQRWDFAAE